MWMPRCRQIFFCGQLCEHLGTLLRILRGKGSARFGESEFGFLAFSDLDSVKALASNAIDYIKG